MKKTNNFEQLADILRPEKQFNYKGDDKRPAQSPIVKHSGISALEASLLRGKELVK